MTDKMTIFVETVEAVAATAMAAQIQKNKLLAPDVAYRTAVLGQIAEYLGRRNSPNEIIYHDECDAVTGPDIKIVCNANAARLIMDHGSIISGVGDVYADPHAPLPPHPAP